MKRFFYLSFITLLLCGCGNLVLETKTASTPTRGSLYPKMYEEKPVSLLIMPPMNYSSNVEAKDLLYTSISRPLIDAGYYVVPTILSMEILREESAYDSELFLDRPLDIFRKYFGVDALVFSEIRTWKKIGVGIETTLRYFIKSTSTGEILFDRTCEFLLNTSVNVNLGNTMAGALISLAVSAANNAATDHIEAARAANELIFADIPRGKYDPLYLTDQNTPAKSKDINAPYNYNRSYKEQVKEIKDAGGFILTIGDKVYKRAPKADN